MRKNYFLSLLVSFFFAASFAQVTLPHYEGFDYMVGTDIATTANWENFSGTDNPIDVTSGSLTYSGFADPTGNAINMVGGFQDDELLFTEVTTGTVYASFLMRVNSIADITDTNDGGYFAIFGSTTRSFRSRLWVKPTVDNTSTTVDFAYTNSSSGSGFGATQNINEVILVVMSYNVDTGELNAWINPDAASFEAGSAPAADLTNTDGSPTSIDRILLRQDSTNETPDMTLDELRIGTTWASVTPSGTVNTDPTISFTSPSNNQVFPSTTTIVPVNFNIQNFVLSGDNGSGMSDGTGDGYIVGTAVENGGAPDSINIFNGFLDYEELEPGDEVTLTAELVDNSGNSLTPAVTAMVSFSVELSCDLQLADDIVACDAGTVGVDTYTVTIPFTQGGTATYTVTAVDNINQDPIGNVGGDNPTTDAAGNIIITGIPEGTGIIVRVTGDSTSSCDYNIDIFSPTCLDLPIYEPFDYPVNNDLIANPLWEDASTSSTPNNIQVVANDDGGGNLLLDSYYGSGVLPPFTGGMVSLEGLGSDPFIGFSEVTSGTVYASFTFNVTDMSNAADPDGGYFAVFTENGSFRGRLWIVDTNPGEGLTYNLGLSTTSGSASDIHTGFTANLAEPVFVVIGYDVDNDTANLWVVPDETTFGTNTPPAANVTLATSATARINRFLLRQDSTNETPAINVDELRIGTTWASVTADATTSTVDNQIDGFLAYPNPVRGNGLTVRTSSIDTKEVALFNVLGRRVFTQSFTGTQDTFDVSSLSSGIYILKVTEGSRIATQKVVIE